MGGYDVERKNNPIAPSVRFLKSDIPVTNGPNFEYCTNALYGRKPVCSLPSPLFWRRLIRGSPARVWRGGKEEGHFLDLEG